MNPQEKTALVDALKSVASEGIGGDVLAISLTEAISIIQNWGQGEQVVSEWGGIKIVESPAVPKGEIWLRRHSDDIEVEKAISSEHWRLKYMELKATKRESTGQPTPPDALRECLQEFVELSEVYDDIFNDHELEERQQFRELFHKSREALKAHSQSAEKQDE